jgi:hypothetical protein
MKRAVLWIIIYSVFVILFNACFFLIGGVEHPLSVWLSYVFIHLAYILVIASSRIDAKDVKRRRVLGLPVTMGATAYFFAEFVTGVICILLRAESATTTFLIQLVLLGIFVLYVAVNMLANSKTDDATEQHQAQVDYLKGNATVLQGLLPNVQDPAVRKQLEAAYDDLRVSPAQTDASVYAVETAIQQSVLWLRDNLQSQSSEVVLARIGELRAQIADRNHILTFGNR